MMILSSTKIFSTLTKPYVRKILVGQFLRLTHYKTLGLNSTATQEEIKAAYFELSKKYHPDVNDNSQESIKKFQEINRAYEVLGKEHLRREYDILCRGGGGANYTRFSKETEEQFAQQRDFFYKKRGPINLDPWFTKFENEELSVRRSFNGNKKSSNVTSKRFQATLLVFVISAVLYINYQLGTFVRDYFIDPRTVFLRKEMEKQMSYINSTDPNKPKRRVFYFFKHTD